MEKAREGGRKQGGQRREVIGGLYPITNKNKS